MAKKTIEERSKEFESKLYNLRSNVKIVGEYKSSRDKLKYLCLDCEKEFEATPNNMLKKTYGGCSHCAQERRTNTLRKVYRKKFNINTEKFREKVEKDGRYKMCEGEEYISNKTKINLFCPTCQKPFGISPVNFDKGKGCPICNRLSFLNSKGVRIIKQWLEDNNYSYKQEVKMNGLKYNKELSLDFVVYINDKIYAIEFDGEQHFRPAFGDDGTKLAITQERDKAKDLFCESNNIPLLRIRYDEITKIKSKLRSFLKPSSTTIETTSNDGRE